MCHGDPSTDAGCSAGDRAYGYAIREIADWIDANPAARVKKPTPEVSRKRVLTDDEIRRFWRVLEHFPTID